MLQLLDFFPQKKKHSFNLISLAHLFSVAFFLFLSLSHFALCQLIHLFTIAKSSQLLHEQFFALKNRIKPSKLLPLHFFHSLNSTKTARKTVKSKFLEENKFSFFPFHYPKGRRKICEHVVTRRFMLNE